MLTSLKILFSKRKFNNTYEAEMSLYLKRYSTFFHFFSLREKICLSEKNSWQSDSGIDFASERYRSQILCTYLLTNFRFSRTLINSLIHNKRMIYPLNREWIKKCDELNIKVNKSISILLFNLFCIFLSIKSFLSLGKILVFNRSEKNIANRNYYFMDFSIDSMKIEKNYYSFLNWFLEQNDLGDQKNIKFMHNQRANSIHHESIKSVIYLPNIICVLSKIDLIKNLLGFIKFAIIDRKFKFKKLLMFVDQYFSWYMIHKNETKFETYEFIFSASKGVIRPIWTYTLPESKIFFFFYAIHSEPKFLDEKPYKDGLWYLSTWKKIHFVDKTQHDEFTEKYNLKPLVFQKFSVPWMVDSESNVEIMEKYVALFDTLPVNREEIVTTFRETGIDVNNLAMAKEFVLAPLEIASELGLTVIHKFKRGNIEKAEREYLEFIIELRERFGKHYVLVDSNISPFRIINKSILVISKPYSTIGLIAKELAKKNIYFDSKNNIQNVDVPFSREIPIINNRLDLKAILEKLA